MTGRLLAAAMLALTTAGTAKAEGPGQLLQQALSLSPTLKLASIDRRRAAAALLSERGAVETALVSNVSWEYELARLSPAALDAEINRRMLFIVLRDDTQRNADELQQKLDEDAEDLSFECGDTEIILNGRRICSTNAELTQLNAQDQLLQSLIDNAETEEQRERLLNVQEMQRNNLRMSLENTVASLRTVAASSDESLRRLGDVSDLEFFQRLSLDLTLARTLANGMTVSGGAILDVERTNYLNKPRQPADGGKPIATSYRSIVGIGLEWPLGRGGGEAAPKTAIAAARADLRASDADLLDSRDQVFRQVLNAYYALLGSEANLALRERSLAIREDIVRYTRALVEADEVPPTELIAATGNADLARAALDSARGARDSQLWSLLNAMGNTDDQRPGGLDGASLPPAPSDAELRRFRQWADQLAGSGGAVTHRIAALHERVAAATLRSARAAADRGPSIDLSLVVGLMGLDESADTVWDGVRAAFSDNYGDVGGLLSVSISWPMRDRTANGAYQLALRDLDRARTRLAEAQRQRSSDARRQLARVRALAARYRAAQRAGELGEESLAQALEKYRAGAETLFDVLRSEEQFVFARLEEIAAHTTLTQAGVDLRFALGDLDPGGADSAPAQADFWNPEVPLIPHLDLTPGVQES